MKKEHLETERDDERPLNVLVVTVKEYYYIPKFLERILNADDINVRGITTVPPSLGTQRTISFAYRLLRVFGARIFTKHTLFYSKQILADLFYRVTNIGDVRSPKALADQHGIDYKHVSDVNTNAYVEYVERVEPDLLVSVAATQKFSEDLLDTPSIDAINIHSSLLPKHRGVSPNFWALLADDDSTGVTVHFMDSEIDTGDVIVQKRFEIEDDNTLHALNKRTAEIGSIALLEALRRFQNGTVDARSIDPDAGSYHSVPERQDIREFLRRGNEFY